MRSFLHSKIHRARVTEANVDYVGSVTIDEALLEAADIKEFEQVHIVDVTNGNRLVTYAIKGKRDSGVIGINGAAAHLVQEGDVVILMTFTLAEEPVEPTCLLVDEENRFVRYLRETERAVPSF